MWGSHISPQAHCTSLRAPYPHPRAGTYTSYGKFSIPTNFSSLELQLHIWSWRQHSSLWEQKQQATGKLPMVKTLSPDIVCHLSSSVPPFQERSLRQTRPTQTALWKTNHQLRCTWRCYRIPPKQVKRRNCSMLLNSFKLQNFFKSRWVRRFKTHNLLALGKCVWTTGCRSRTATTNAQNPRRRNSRSEGRGESVDESLGATSEFKDGWKMRIWMRFRWNAKLTMLWQNKKTVEPWGYVLHYGRLQLYLSTLLMPVHGYLLYL